RLVLGARARTMDRILRDTARSRGAVHAPMDEAMARDRGLFSTDGFHPSPAGYRAWAEDLARAAAPVPPPPPDPAPGSGPDAVPDSAGEAPPAESSRPGRGPDPTTASEGSSSDDGSRNVPKGGG